MKIISVDKDGVIKAVFSAAQVPKSTQELFYYEVDKDDNFIVGETYVDHNPNPTDDKDKKDKKKNKDESFGVIVSVDSSGIATTGKKDKSKKPYKYHCGKVGDELFKDSKGRFYLKEKGNSNDV